MPWIIFLPILAIIASCPLPAIAERVARTNETSLSTALVPVFVVSERPNVGAHYNVDFQRYQGPSVRFGVLEMPRPRHLYAVDLDELKSLGCTLTANKIVPSNKTLTRRLHKFPGIGTAYGNLTSMFNEDPNFLAIPSIYEGSFDKFAKTIVSSANDKGVVIFVHGCCIPLRTALIGASDLVLSFGLPVLCFDWNTPSNALHWLFPELNPYRQAERAFEVSQLNFNDLMDSIVARIPANKIILVGHSIGSRMIEQYLIHYSSKGRFKQVHFVNADMSAPAFLEQERDICKNVETVYAYTSSKDNAIGFSQAISANVVRVGRSQGFLEWYTCVKDFSYPNNRYFINLSEYPVGPPILHHSMPCEVLAAVSKQGHTAKTNSWEIIPASTKPFHGNLLKLQFLPKSTQ